VTLTALRSSTRRETARVVHVCRRYHPLTGGTERYVRDLARAQASRGYEVWVLTLCRDVTRTTLRHLPHRDEDGEVRIIRVPGVGTARVALATRPDAVLNVLSQASAIHLHDLRFAFAEAALAGSRNSTPIFVHTHGLFFHTPVLQHAKTLAIKYYFAPILARIPGVILASSNADAEQLLTRASQLRRKLRYFPNAIDLSPLLPVVPRRHGCNLLVHGRVAHTKRIDRAIEAVAALGRRGVRLRVAGAAEPGERERLTNVARACGVADQVQFLGHYDDHQLVELLSQTDVALFPSPGEGFGLALLEAMAAGVPAVANNIPAHREVLGPDLSFLLTDFANPSAAARIIGRILDMNEHSWEQVSAAARARAQRFDLPALVDELERVYAGFGIKNLSDH
jgi:alpha-1,3-mannosyltransferase